MMVCRSLSAARTSPRSTQAWSRGSQMSGHVRRPLARTTLIRSCCAAATSSSAVISSSCSFSPGLTPMKLIWMSASGSKPREPGILAGEVEGAHAAAHAVRVAAGGDRAVGPPSRGRAEGAVNAVDDLVAQEGLALRRADLHACLLVKSVSRRSRHLHLARGELVGHPGAEELHLQRRLRVAVAVLVAEVGDEGLESEERADGRLRRLLQK